MPATQPSPPSTATPGSLQFRAGETLAAALDRVVATQFELAKQLYSSAPADQALAVHETRKAIKRLRAMIRLVRDHISIETYQADNATLRLVGAELSHVRDSWVMIQSMNSLSEVVPEALDAIKVLAGRLEERYVIAAASLLGNRALLSSTEAQLDSVATRASRWSTPAGDPHSPLPHVFASISGGLRRVYKRSRRGYQIACDSPTTTLLHSWRKQAKYLRHQMEALNVLQPVSLGALANDLAYLTDLLGDDHDLAILGLRLDRDPQLVANTPTGSIAEAIRSERFRLQTAAFTLAGDLFSKPPGAFAEELERLWGHRSTF